MGGLIHIGLENYSGGRAGDSASIALSKRLRELPFRVDRLKTGTPPRIDGRTIDFDKLEVQPGDEILPVFSYMGRREQHPRQIPVTSPVRIVGPTILFVWGWIALLCIPV